MRVAAAALAAFFIASPVSAQQTQLTINCFPLGTAMTELRQAGFEPAIQVTDGDGDPWVLFTGKDGWRLVLLMPAQDAACTVIGGHDQPRKVGGKPA